MSFITQPRNINISGMVEKTTPVDTDLLVMEDSADNNAKKKVKIGNALGISGNVTSVDGMTGVVVLLDAISSTLT